MSRLLDALGIAAGKAALFLLIILIGGLNIFPSTFVGILMFVAAVSAQFFSRWLKDRGTLLESPPHHEFARYFNWFSIGLSIIVFIRFAVPVLIPGPASWVKSKYSQWENHSRQVALENLAPKEVPCGKILIGPNGEIIYHYLPGDPFRCYDKAGEHPEGKGELLPVTPEIAQIITQQRQRVATATPAVPTREQILELVRTEVVKVQPTAAPKPAEHPATPPPPQTPRKGTWLKANPVSN